MADIKDFKHAIVRQKILEAVKKDLIGLGEPPLAISITLPI